MRAGVYVRYHGVCKKYKNPGKKKNPIIHWRNPIRGLYYYPKGLRRKRLAMREQKWRLRRPLSENAVFKPSSVILPINKQVFQPSMVIPRQKVANL